MLVLKNVPLQLRFFTSGFSSRTAARAITLERSKLVLSRRQRRGCCIAAEVSAGFHLESFRDKEASKDVDSSGGKEAPKRTSSRRKREPQPLQDQSCVSNEVDNLIKPSVEKPKPRRRAEKLTGEKLEDGSRKPRASKAIGEKTRTSSGKRKSSGDGDEAEEPPTTTTEDDAKPRRPRAASAVRRKSKASQAQELGSSHTEGSENLLPVTEVPRSSESVEDPKDLGYKDASFSAGGVSVIDEKTKVPDATRSPPELQSETMMESAGRSEANSEILPLYMQIETRRLEEQQKRASTSSKKKKYSPVSELRFTLDYCSKFGDVNGALAAYEAQKETIPFDLYNFNVLLYLCSSAALGVLIPFKRSRQRPDYGENEFGLSEVEVVEENGVVLRGNMAGLVGKNEMGFTREMMEMFLRRGLEIYEEMKRSKVAPDDATFTSLARLAVAKVDGELAFEIVKEMVSLGLAPKLRCYGPALFVYFRRSDASKALEVYEHMLSHGVEPDEAELEMLLELNSRAGFSGEVYSLLQQLRRTVREVSESTVRVIERWFSSGSAVGASSSFIAGGLEVMRASAARGGGWHGLGWLGEGAWSVNYTQLSSGGVCSCCGEQMITIDVDPQRTESFAESVASLALKREQSLSFGAFKDWLDRNEPYLTIVDGANVGFHNQRGEEINFAQLNSVVNEIYRATGRWPLVILHVKRTTTGPGKSALAQQLLRKLSIANALYTTPVGSNDDWYWLYAAVKSKSLLVSNDEMRDHIFQLLGRDYFPTWKERHQVRFRVSDRGPEFFMPPPYSIIIQESVRGSWHVPVSGGDDISTPRRWLCVKRG